MNFINVMKPFPAFGTQFKFKISHFGFETIIPNGMLLNTSSVIIITKYS